MTEQFPTPGFKKLKSDDQKYQKGYIKAKQDGVINPRNYNFTQF